LKAFLLQTTEEAQREFNEKHPKSKTLTPSKSKPTPQVKAPSLPPLTEAEQIKLAKVISMSEN